MFVSTRFPIFPPSLKEAIQKSRGLKNEKGIKKALRDKSTLAAYAKWSFANTRLIRESQKLQKIDRIARQIAPGEMPNTFLVNVIKTAQMFIAPSEVERLKQQIVLLKLGVLSISELQQDHNLIKPLFTPDGIREVLSPIAALPTLFFGVLSIQDEKGNTPLHNPQNLALINMLLTYNGTQRPDLLKDALAVTNNKGETPLHCAENINTLVNDLPGELFKELLFKEDNDKNIPLYVLSFANIKKLKSTLEYIKADHLERLITRKPDEAEFLIRFFEPLSGDEISGLLEKTYKNGNPLLHSPENYQQILPHLHKCTAAQLTSLFLMKKGDTPLLKSVLLPPNLEATVNLLAEKFTSNELNSLLNQIYLDVSQVRAFLTSNQLSDLKKIKILFLQNVRLYTSEHTFVLGSALSSAELLRLAMPVLENFNGHYLKKLFLGKDKEVPFFANFLVHYCEAKSKENFCFGNMKASEYNAYFQALLPLFEQISISDVYSIFAKLNPEVRFTLFSLVSPTEPFKNLLNRFNFKYLFPLIVSREEVQKKPLLSNPAILNYLWPILTHTFEPETITTVFALDIAFSDISHFPEEVFSYLKTLEKWQRKAILWSEDQNQKKLGGKMKSPGVESLMHDFTPKEKFDLRYCCSEPGERSKLIKNPLYKPFYSELADSFKKPGPILSLTRNDLFRFIKKQQKFLDTLLHFPNNLFTFLPFLKKLTFEQRIELLSIQNCRGETPIVEEQNVIAFLDSGIARNLHQLKRVLYLRDGRGLSLMDRPRHLKKVLEWATKLSEEDHEFLFRELSYQRMNFIIRRDNEENHPYTEFYKAAVPLFLRKEKEEAIMLLKIMIRENQSLLHFPDILHCLQPVLETFDVETIEELLTMQAGSGSLPIEPGKRVAAIPLILKKFSLKQADHFFKKHKSNSPEFEQEEIEWANSSPNDSEKIKRFFLLLLAGNIEKTLPLLLNLTEQQLQEVFGDEAEFAYDTIQLAHFSDFAIRQEHMQEGAPISCGAPTPINMNQVTFIGENNHKPYSGYSDFLPDMIAAARAEGSLDDASEISFTRVAQRFSRNEPVTQLVPENDDERLLQYKYYLAHFSHIIAAYKIGQVGGVLKDKRRVLHEIFQMHSSCFPRWIEQIQQLYFSRPSTQNPNETPLTFNDRILARLRAERLDILTTKLSHTGGVDIHEVNFLRDLFREELGTQLPSINDPTNDNIALIYNRDKEMLRSEFDLVFYNKEFLIQSICEHINAQKRRRIPSIDPIDLKPEEVEQQLKSWYLSSERIKDEMYAIHESVRGRTNQKEIARILASQGIDWYRGQTVEQAIESIATSIRGIRFTLQSLIPRIYRDIALTEAITENKALEVRHLIQRYNMITKDSQMDLAAFTSKVDAWKKNKEQALSNLEQAQAHLTTLATREEKKKYLLENRLIKTKQPLAELLSDNHLKAVLTRKFLEEFIYNATRNFTKMAAAYLLISCGVLTNPYTPKRPLQMRIEGLD